MDDVAAAAGVSRALVSLVMRGSPRVSDRSRAAVREAAERLGYRPNLAARNLASGRTSTFGVLLNDLHNPWFAEIADGIHDAADGAGYQIIIANGRRSAATEDRAVESFLAHRVDGMILAGCRLPAGRIDGLGAKTAVVSVGRPLRSSRVDTVNTDERLGSRAGGATPRRTRASRHRPHRRRPRRRGGAAESGLPGGDERRSVSATGAASWRATSPRRRASMASRCSSRPVGSRPRSTPPTT